MTKIFTFLVQAVHMTVEAESRPSMAQPFLVLNLEVFDTEEAKRLPIAEMFVNVENQVQLESSVERPSQRLNNTVQIK